VIGIESIGAITAAGDDGPNTMASIISELHLFDDIGVLDFDGQFLTGARTALSKKLRGANRLAGLGILALTECAARAPKSVRAPIFLCAPSGRDLDPDRLLDAITADASIATDRKKSRVFATGRGGIIEALQNAAELLQPGGAPACYLVGVDSVSETKQAQRLWQERKLFHRTNPDGFIPGEAGAALFLTAQASAAALACIEGVGRGAEPEQDVVTGTALSRALVQAIGRAKLEPDKLAALVHDSSGARRFSEELTLASQRPPFNRIADGSQTFAPADFTGEIGAASGALSLAMAAFFISEAVIQGPALVTFLAEGSERGAAVVSPTPRRRAPPVR
jgi:3-oxoacyl-[acyl-carrier-protein] synthase-1